MPKMPKNNPEAFRDFLSALQRAVDRNSNTAGRLTYATRGMNSPTQIDVTWQPKLIEWKRLDNDSRTSGQRETLDWEWQAFLQELHAFIEGTCLPVSGETRDSRLTMTLDGRTQEWLFSEPGDPFTRLAQRLWETASFDVIREGLSDVINGNVPPRYSTTLDTWDSRPGCFWQTHIVATKSSVESTSITRRHGSEETSTRDEWAWGQTQRVALARECLRIMDGVEFNNWFAGILVSGGRLARVAIGDHWVSIRDNASVDLLKAMVTQRSF